MKIMVIPFVVLLGGCAYNLSLYPRGSGEVAKGVGNSATREMTVNLSGETYAGKYVQFKQSAGIISAYGLGNQNPLLTASAASGSSNYYYAMLASAKSAIRCEFIAESHGGHGVCVDGANKVYDLMIERQ